MTKRGKKSSKNKVPKRKTTAKRGNSRATKKRAISKKEKMSRPTKVTAKPVVKSNAKVMKTPEELKTLRQKFAASFSAATAGACYFKDPSGGPDQCIPATQEDCKSEGGVWTPGNCPN